SLATESKVDSTGTHKITQADLDSAFFMDTAIDEDDGTRASAVAEVQTDQKPKLGLTKKDDLNPAKYDHVGQVVTYTLVATNEGRSEERRVGKDDWPPLEGYRCTQSIAVAGRAH